MYCLISQHLERIFKYETFQTPLRYDICLTHKLFGNFKLVDITRFCFQNVNALAPETKIFRNALCCLCLVTFWLFGVTITINFQNFWLRNSRYTYENYRKIFVIYPFLFSNSKLSYCALSNLFQYLIR